MTRRRGCTPCRDPLTNTSTLERGQIDAFLADLATVSSNPLKSGLADTLLNHPFDVTFSTANGGDVPVGASWSLPDALSGRLLKAMADSDFVGALHAAAEDIRGEEKSELEARLACLARCRTSEFLTDNFAFSCRRTSEVRCAFRYVPDMHASANARASRLSVLMRRLLVPYIGAKLGSATMTS